MIHLVILPKLFSWLLLPVFCFQSNSSTKQQSDQRTLTTSGEASPIASETGTAATTGSIAVGSGGKYQEAGSVDINSGGGSNITIGDPNADTLISNLADKFSNTVQNVAAGTAGAVAANSSTGTPGSISYKTLGLVAAAIAAILVIFEFFKGGKRA